MRNDIDDAENPDSYRDHTAEALKAQSEAARADETRNDADRATHTHAHDRADTHADTHDRSAQDLKTQHKAQHKAAEKADALGGTDQADHEAGMGGQHKTETVSEPASQSAQRAAGVEHDEPDVTVREHGARGEKSS